MDSRIQTNSHIIVVDSSDAFNEQLSNQLRLSQYQVSSFLDIESFQELLQKNTLENPIHLIILETDKKTQKVTQNLLQLIEEKTDAKVILTSKEDIGVLREEYFKQGILDYYLKTKNINHIISNINDTLEKQRYNKQETILLMIGSLDLRGLLQKLLEQRSYRVLTANSTQEGLEVLQKTELTLVVLDMELVGGTDFTLLEKLKDIRQNNEFLIMAISQKDDPSLVRDAFKSGVSNFIKEPFLYEEFLLKTDILVESSRSKKIITKQKKKIEDSLKSFKELVNSSINVMFIFKKNICVDCNNEAIELLEYSSKKELVGKSLKDIFGNISSKHYAELLENSTDHYFEDKLISRSGKSYDVQIKERNILIGGRLLKIIAVMDITEIKRNNKIISQQSKMASMGEMIGNIAHQWRQPLTAISVAASGIKLNYELEMEDRAETLQELDNIVRNTKFLSSTIEDFQNYLKNDRSLSQFFIQDTVKKTLAIIQANLESHEIKIVQEYEQNLQMEGVQNDLVQILLNVINNSVDVLKLKPLGEKRIIYIHIKFEEEYAYISVYDSGGGISKDIIEKVFDPYFTTKHQTHGTGLGLYMTHQIIEKIGGAINVSNEAFEFEDENYFGAKFTLKVPINFIN